MTEPIAPATDEDIARVKIALSDTYLITEGESGLVVQQAWRHFYTEAGTFAPALISRIEAQAKTIAELREKVDEARATKDMHKERAEEAWEEVHRLQHQETERNHNLRAEVQRLKDRLAEVGK